MSWMWCCGVKRPFTTRKRPFMTVLPCDINDSLVICVNLQWRDTTQCYIVFFQMPLFPFLNPPFILFRDRVLFPASLLCKPPLLLWTARLVYPVSIMIDQCCHFFIVVQLHMMAAPVWRPLGWGSSPLFITELCSS